MQDYFTDPGDRTDADWIAISAWATTLAIGTAFWLLVFALGIWLIA